MSILGFASVLAAATCHATWNFFVKRIGGGPELIWLFSVLSTIIYMPIALWIILQHKLNFQAVEIGFIAGSVILHLGYFVLIQMGYRKGDLSVVYPTARATGPLISASLAVLVLGETITVQMAIGAGIVIIGVAMLTGGVRFYERRLPASLLFGLGAGTLIGSYTAWDAFAVSTLLIPPVLLDFTSSVGRVALLAPLAMRRWPQIRGHWSHHRAGVIAIAIFNPLAYILVLYALTFTPVTYVAPTREVSVLLTVLAGSLLLNEGELGKRLGWAAVILAGMVILVSA